MFITPTQLQWHGEEKTLRKQTTRVVMDLHAPQKELALLCKTVSQRTPADYSKNKKTATWSKREGFPVLTLLLVGHELI